VRRLILAAFFLETGFLLIIIPWSAYWDRNYFVQWPGVHVVLTNNFVRGAISGIGLVNVISGIAELAAVFLVRRTLEPPSAVRMSRPTKTQLPH
jgi:hypothetical protein